MKTGFLSASLLALFVASCQSSNVRSPLDDRTSLEAAKKAFFESWTKREGETFTLDKLSAVADNSQDFLSFDGMSETKTVISGYDAYAAIWGPGMNAFKSGELTETKALRTWFGGDVAVTASIARISAEFIDGTKLDVQGHLTLAWRRDGESWRAVHEHMSLGVKQ